MVRRATIMLKTLPSIVKSVASFFPKNFTVTTSYNRSDIGFGDLNVYIHIPKLTLMDKGIPHIVRDLFVRFTFTASENNDYVKLQSFTGDRATITEKELVSGYRHGYLTPRSSPGFTGFCTSGGDLDTMIDNLRYKYNEIVFQYVLASLVDYLTHIPGNVNPYARIEAIGGTRRSFPQSVRRLAAEVLRTAPIKLVFNSDLYQYKLQKQYYLEVAKVDPAFYYRDGEESKKYDYEYYTQNGVLKHRVIVPTEKDVAFNYSLFIDVFHVVEKEILSNIFAFGVFRKIKQEDTFKNALGINTVTRQPDSKARLTYREPDSCSTPTSS